MSVIKKWCVTAGVAVVALASLGAQAQANEINEIVKRGELRVAVQTSGPLMSFMDKNGQRTGLAVEVVKRMADDMGVKLVLQDYDWKGLIPALTSGKVDMLAADMTPTPQRAMQVLFSRPVFYAETMAVAAKDSPYTTWQDLNAKGKNVGALGASTYAEAVRKMMPDATLKEYSGGSAPVGQAISTGRVDGGIMARSTASQFLVDFDNLKILEGVMVNEPLAFAVKSDAYNLKFWLDNWVEMRTGRLLSPVLVDYWYSTDWKKDH
jgi:polar amino acid transport system substrate-binding protein